MLSQTAMYFFNVNDSKNSSIMNVGGVTISRAYASLRIQSLYQMLSMFKQFMNKENYDHIVSQFLHGKSLEEFVYGECETRGLLLSSAYSMGLEDLSDEYVQKKLQDKEFIREHLVDSVPQEAITEKGINYNILFTLGQQYGIGIEDFEKEMENTIRCVLCNALLNLFSFSTQSRVTQAKINHFSLPYNKMISSDSIECDENDLRSFYHQQNKGRALFSTSEKREIMLWTFSSDAYFKSKGIIAHDEKEKKEQFSKRFGGDVKALIASSRSQSVLSEFANKYGGKESKQSFSSQIGGFYEKKAFSISNVGGVSYGIDEKGIGFIILLIQKTPSQLIPFEDCIDDVKRAYKEHEINNRVKQEIDTIRLEFDNDKTCRKTIKTEDLSLEDIKKSHPNAIRRIQKLSREGMSFAIYDDVNSKVYWYGLSRILSQQELSFSENIKKNQEKIEEYKKHLIPSLKNYVTIMMY